jgi:hypothetical protein
MVYKHGHLHTVISNFTFKRLRWSRGSVLTFGTQVRGFKPGRSPSDFSGRKNPQHVFLGGEVKGVLSHVAYLRHVKEP